MRRVMGCDVVSTTVGSISSACYGSAMSLSPDGKAIAFENAATTFTEQTCFATPVASTATSASANSTCQPGVYALGWLDASTAVEVTPGSTSYSLQLPLSLYDIRSDRKLRDLGVSGIFGGLL